MKVCQLSLLVVALITGTLMGASQALAADGRPSQTTLASMGLADLHVMTDSEGLAVRGLGYYGASAAGKSWASIAGYGASAGSVNSYNAKGKYVAGGRNESEAGLEVKTSGGYGNHGNKSNNSHGSSKPKSIKIEVFAGGSSIGFTKR
jgi:hypothetical protein